MRTLAGDGDIEKPATGHRGDGHDAVLANRHARAIVHAVHRIAWEALEQIIVEHGERAADAFLAGLEDEVHRAIELARLGQIARRAEQHGGVSVMPAGVHRALIAAAIRDVVGFGDRQRVHVGAQPDRALAVAGAQHADHAGAADRAMHLDPPFLEL
jgi:hypothetical protein